MKPNYKPGWEVPGGVVALDESPCAACVREFAEELGHTHSLGRLSVMEWQGPEPDRSESLMFLYDGGRIVGSDIRLQTSELRTCAFVTATDLDTYLNGRLARRMRAALMALRRGGFVEMENGYPLPDCEAT